MGIHIFFMYVHVIFLNNMDIQLPMWKVYQMFTYVIRFLAMVLLGLAIVPSNPSGTLTLKWPVSCNRSRRDHATRYKERYLSLGLSRCKHRIYSNCEPRRRSDVIVLCCHDSTSLCPDPKEPLVPPRFIERFSNRTVKQGASITLSVRVEGLFSHLLLNTSRWSFRTGVLNHRAADGYRPEQHRPPVRRNLEINPTKNMNNVLPKQQRWSHQSQPHFSIMLKSSCQYCLMLTQYITVVLLDCYCQFIKLCLYSNNGPSVSVFIRFDEAGI